MEKKIKFEIEKPKKGSLVTMPEIINMKVLRIQGFSIQSIANKVGRGHKTVDKSLKLLEEILPAQAGLKNKIVDRIEQVTERHLLNAEIICESADRQVMGKINNDETTAAEAAKIRQIYGGFLTGVLGIKPGEEVTANSPKIVNFINTIINVQKTQKDDRPITTTEDKGTDEKDVKGGEAVSVEGIVL